MFSQSDWLSPFCKKAAKLVVDNMKIVLKIDQKSMKNRPKMGSEIEDFSKSVSGHVSEGFGDDFGSHFSSQTAPKSFPKSNKNWHGKKKRNSEGW